ncbi:MAG: IS5/IS1182 family transposase, partial [Chthoniobacteraceae bacterium]
MAYAWDAKKKEPYASDASDEEWAFCAPYLSLKRKDAPQRAY